MSRADPSDSLRMSSSQWMGRTAAVFSLVTIVELEWDWNLNIRKRARKFEEIISISLAHSLNIADHAMK